MTRFSIQQFLRSLLLGPAILGWGGAAHAQIDGMPGNDLMQIRLAAGYESNVPRGVDAFHERDSGFIEASVFAGRFLQLSLQDSLTLGLETSARSYHDESGFGQLAAGLNVSYGHRFGMGAYAPSLNLDLQYRFQNSRGLARDHQGLTTGLNYRQRLSPAWVISFGADYYEGGNQKALPEDPRVTAFGYDPDISLPYTLYDFDSRSLFAGAEYTFRNYIMWSAEYRRGNGHTVASTTMPTLKTYKISRAFYSDPAFSEDWFAYLLPSGQHEWSSTLSFPLGGDAALDITASWVDIAAPEGKRYENSLITASLIWRL